MTARRGIALLCLLAFGLPAQATEEALREGNRRFRRGDLEGALEAYRAGYSSHGHDPVLAYNLGATAHHLGSLPEAVLWYRRAMDAGNDADLWLAQNLDSARRALGAPRLPPPTPWSLLEAHRARLAWIAVGLAWLSLGLAWIARRRDSPTWARWTDVLGVSALTLFLVAVLAGALAPTPAVLLEPCGEGAAQLPAGSEVWGRFNSGDGFRIQHAGGDEVLCPESSVGRVRTSQAFFLLL